MLILFSGCRDDPGADESLTIATAWPETERAELEQAFGRWVEEQPGAAPGRPRIDWIVLARADDPARLGNRPSWLPEPLDRAPDVLLGGPASSYRRLARADRLVAADPARPETWFVARRSLLGWAMSAKAAGDTTRRPGLSFDDPRHDPIALAWARAELGAGRWAEGYARLVREAAYPRRIGRVPGSSLAAVDRGELEATPAVAASVRTRPADLVFRPFPRAPEWLEGVAIVTGGRHRERARAFLRFLGERGNLGPADQEPGPEPDGLLADLLGATLVDAQDELWLAWKALERNGRPARSEGWMTQAPPWPPASVTKLGQRDATGSLMGTLAEQVAPDPTTRAWLLRSWLEPERPIDGRRLDELNRAVEGRLVREPRFRAWLRAEWTAWARQRYRRVARTAKGSAQT